MVIDFEKDEIKAKELKNGIPYVGYFSPMGKIIDYNVGLGGQTHNSWTNPVSSIYLKYVSYIITNETIDGSYGQYLKEHNPDKLKEMISDGLNELVYRGHSSYYGGVHSSFKEFYEEIISDIEKYENIIKYDRSDEYDKFILDLLKFFEKAYKNRDYIKTTNKITRIDNQKDIEKRVKEEFFLEEDDEYICNRLVEREVNKELLSCFKDICVQFIGYDSIERYGPNGNKITIPKNEEDYDSFFYKTPRVITTSNNDIYNRFYNYLIMDWDVYKVPRFIYDKKKEEYVVLENNLNQYRQEREEEIKEEIQSIKRLVPPYERNKFFK